MTREKLQKVVIAWTPGALRALAGAVVALVTGLAFGWDWVAANWPLWAFVFVALNLFTPVPTFHEIAFLKTTMHELGAVFNDARYSCSRSFACVDKVVYHG